MSRKVHMARKRMFDSEIINQDNFLDLSMESKALYFLLGMEADDEGFVSPKKVMRLYGGTIDSLKNLAERNFIIPFKTGIVVITDWKRNNYLDKNRMKETIYQNEKSQLSFNTKSEKYELLLNPYNSSVKPMFNECLTSIEEKSIEEYRRVENRVDDDQERPEYQTPSSSSPSNSQERPESETTRLFGNGNQERPDNKTPELSNEILNIFEYLETNFGRTISPTELEIINSYEETFGTDIIKEAIDRACINNAKTIRYVMGILESWKSKGFNKIEECKSEFNEVKNKSQKTEPIPEWFNKEFETKEASQEEKKEMEELLRKFQ